MEKVRLAAADPKAPLQDVFTFLSRFYDIEYCEDDPDFVLCGDVGAGIRNEYLDYDCPRIRISAENLCPDFNVYDYAIGYQHMAFEDRYLRFPYYYLHYFSDGSRTRGEKQNLRTAMEKHENEAYLHAPREKFCNFIVSNARYASPIRIDFFRALSQYKKVDSGGRLFNNIGGPVGNKMEFQQRYKFSIAFENASSKGYITEKIIEAWAAGTIPIYWGAADIAEEFNPQSFIHVKGYEDFDRAIAQIRAIDNDDSLFRSMAAAPIAAPGSRIRRLIDEEYLRAFFEHIFSQGRERAYRRDTRFLYGCVVENHAGKYALLNRWDALERKGGSLSEELGKRGCSAIAIYGAGAVGKRVVSDIKLTGKITIAGIIDNNFRAKRYFDIGVYPESDAAQIKGIGCILVTLAYKDFSDIKSRLSSLTGVKIIGLDELIRSQ